MGLNRCLVVRNDVVVSSRKMVPQRESKLLSCIAGTRRDRRRVSLAVVDSGRVTSLACFAAAAASVARRFVRFRSTCDVIVIRPESASRRRRGWRDATRSADRMSSAHHVTRADHVTAGNIYIYKPSRCPTQEAVGSSGGSEIFQMKRVSFMRLLSVNCRRFV